MIGRCAIVRDSIDTITICADPHVTLGIFAQSYNRTFANDVIDQRLAAPVAKSVLRRRYCCNSFLVKIDPHIAFLVTDHLMYLEMIGWLHRYVEHDIIHLACRMVDDLEAIAISTHYQVGCLAVVNKVSYRCLGNRLVIEFYNRVIVGIIDIDIIIGRNNVYRAIDNMEIIDIEIRSLNLAYLLCLAIADSIETIFTLQHPDVILVVASDPKDTMGINIPIKF